MGVCGAKEKAHQAQQYIKDKKARKHFKELNEHMELRATFHENDLDCDGFLDKDDLRRLFRSRMKEHDLKEEEACVSSFMLKVDKN
jgi:hypothetical protein